MNISNAPSLSSVHGAAANSPTIAGGGIQRSSAPTLHPDGDSANARNRLTGLPVELLTQIVGHVQRTQGVFGLQALVHTSRQLRALGDIKSIGRVHELQRRIVCAATALAREVFDGNEAIERHPSLLGLLPAEQRARLAQTVFSTSDGDERLTLLAQLGGQLEHLSESQRRQFVTQVLAEMSGGDELSVRGRHRLLDEIGPQLMHLSEVDRGRLVGGVVAIDDEETRSFAIFYIGRGLAHLSPELRTQLFEAALAITEVEYIMTALAGIGCGVDHLSEPQRRQFVDRALALENVLDRLHALVGPSGGTLMHLSATQREALFNDMFAIDDADARSVAFDLMVPGLVHLTEAQRDRFVQATVAFTNESFRSSLVGALGAELIHLTPVHREQLLTAAVELVGTDNDTNSVPAGYALGGLALGLPHLDGTQRDRLVDAALALTEASEGSASALYGLVAGLQHLSETPRERVAEAALALPAATEGRHVLRRLTVAMAHLDEDQRERAAASALQINSADMLAALMAGAATLGESPRMN